jgi:hypothetical protein
VAVGDLQILDPDHRGIDVRNSRGCSVQGCEVRDARPAPAMLAGIAVAGGRDNWIAGNRVRGAARSGIELDPTAGTESGNLCE